MYDPYFSAFEICWDSRVICDPSTSTPASSSSTEILPVPWTCDFPIFDHERDETPSPSFDSSTGLYYFPTDSTKALSSASDGRHTSDFARPSNDEGYLADDEGLCRRCHRAVSEGGSARLSKRRETRNADDVEEVDVRDVHRWGKLGMITVDSLELNETHRAARTQKSQTAKTCMGELKRTMRKVFTRRG